MMPDEKEKLLTLFDDEGRWCRGSEARDDKGDPVCFDDKSAVAWDLVGGICHLFGWSRGRELFGQIYRHVLEGQGNRQGQVESTAAMTALLDFNDAADTTYERIVTVIEEMPVWRGRPSASPALPPEPDLSGAGAHSNSES